MSVNRIAGATTFVEPVTFLQPPTLPNGSIAASKIVDGANVESSKLMQRPTLDYGQANGADVVSQTKLLRVCRAAGRLLAFDVRPTTVPAGGDKQFTVDLQKAVDGSNTWVSLLTAAVVIDSGETDHTAVAGTPIGSPITAAGDALRVVVTASGSTGSQGQGFIATAIYEEAPG